MKWCQRIAMCFQINKMLGSPMKWRQRRAMCMRKESLAAVSSKTICRLLPRPSCCLIVNNFGLLNKYSVVTVVGILLRLVTARSCCFGKVPYVFQTLIGYTSCSIPFQLLGKASLKIPLLFQIF